MKRAFGILALCLILTLAGTAFSGCGLFGEATAEVSTAEQLQEAQGNIRLTGDIDLGGKVFDPISVGNFDGGGYTISNAIIVASGSKEHASFFSQVKSGVCNVTFENISLSGENVACAGIVWDGADRGKVDNDEREERVFFENVHVKNSSLEILQKTNEDVGYFGGMVGGGGVIFEGCTVDGLTADISGYEPTQDGTYVFGPDIYMGGLAGNTGGATDCSIANSEITVLSNQRYSEPYVGGLVGSLNDAASGCQVTGNTIEVSALYYRHISLTNAYECSDVYLGGLFGISGSDGSVRYCGVDGNTLQANSVGGYYLAGIGGSVSAAVSQCTVTGNNFVGVGRLDGEDKYGDPWTRNIGGISASASAVTFSSSFSYGNEMTATLTLNGNSATDPTGSAVGFSKTTADAVFLNCATGANTMAAGTTDEFATAVLKNVAECYVTSELYGNARELPVISEADWLSEEAISDLLGLSGSRWQFAPGEIPHLSFS